MSKSLKRLYVGNIFTGVTEDDIEKRLNKFGSVSKIEVKCKRNIDGEVTETFAFVDLSSTEDGLAHCISKLNNTKWKGNVLKVQQAKESFMERLARERKERDNETGAKSSTIPESVTDNIEDKNKTKRDFTEEREDFKGFGDRKKSDSKYDPMSMFKAKLVGDESTVAQGENENPEDVGEVKDGLIVFGEDNEAKDGLFNVGKMKVNKVYHSSSEEEDERKTETKENNSVKKSLKEDKKSAEFKQKMTERFLQKQKEALESKNKENVLKKNEKETKSNSRYYSDSDDESADESSKTGKEVLKKVQSFAGEVWKDSDDESEQVKHIENDDEDEDESDYDEEESSEAESEEEEEESVPKPPDEMGNQTMIRYDPTSMDQDKFLLKDTVETQEKENTQDLDKKASFTVTTDLKKAFTASKTSSSFSFGFSKDKPDDEMKASKVADNESDEESIAVNKSQDFSTSFGLQLRGKGANKSENPFFFTAEDPRLEAGLDFFFEHKVDKDVLREQFNAQRPILAEILRKRARSKAKRDKASGGKKRSLLQGTWRRDGKAKRRKIK